MFIHFEQPLFYTVSIKSVLKKDKIETNYLAAKKFYSQGQHHGSGVRSETESIRSPPVVLFPPTKYRSKISLARGYTLQSFLR